MAKVQRFNPPPGWPPAPQGWQPPLGWKPDPSWRPVPPGWPLWVIERANPKAWGLALLSAAGWFVVLVVVGVVAAGGSITAEGTGQIFGRELVAGLVVGAIAWFGRSRWRLWLYVVVVLGVSLVLSALSIVGQLNGT